VPQVLAVQKISVEEIKPEPVLDAQTDVNDSLNDNRENRSATPHDEDSTGTSFSSKESDDSKDDSSYDKTDSSS